MQKVELLAPAGNPEGFYGAISAGADAVYLGGDKFGARAYADNFTTEELTACIRYAHILGRKVYLTVNTLVKESEFDEIYPYLLPFYEAGLDGVIVQDIGVFCYIREHFPGMELHVSTQMTITGPYGAKLLGEMGASRIVPARELSLEEIKDLKAQSGLEVECFIHGAMCYCYSGQCLFSSMLGGRSGNRGKCAQPCRLPYQAEINGRQFKESYPLSLKDMCTIDHIPELIEAGIDSFKIEGRMKKPEYAAGVTAIYRKYIDRYYAGKDCQVTPEDMHALTSLYIRSERQDGYYYRHNSKEMVTITNPSYSSTDEVLVERIRQKYIETRPRIPVGISGEFRKGSPARLVFTLLDAKEDSPIEVVISGETVSPAQKQPITGENIRKQAGKLGDTLFTAEAFSFQMDTDCFYSLKSLNEMRRQAVSTLEDRLISRYGLCVTRTSPANAGKSAQGNSAVTRESSSKQDSSIHVSVRTTDQLEGILNAWDRAQTRFYPVKRLYLDGDLAIRVFSQKDHVRLKNRLTEYLRKNGECRLILALSPILRRRDKTYLAQLKELAVDTDRIDGFLIRSMDGMGYVRELSGKVNKPFLLYTDAGFYHWNQQSLQAFSVDGFCLPYELKAGDQHRLLRGMAAKPMTIACEKTVYGYIPLMVTANCVFRTLDHCRQNTSADTSAEPGIAYLTDRYRKRFPVTADCDHCMNILYNCLPLSLHGELDKWQGTVDFRVDFSIENKDQTEQVLRYFLSGCKSPRPYAESTSGHEKRGAE